MIINISATQVRCRYVNDRMREILKKKIYDETKEKSAAVTLS